MCIILGAIFQISFDIPMNTAKNMIDNSITLVVHSNQIIASARNDYEEEIKEFSTLKNTCSWTTTIKDKCINDEDEFCCIKMLADDASGVQHSSGDFIDGRFYEEVIKFDLLRKGRHVIMKSYLTQHELSWGEQFNQLMGWHRSEGRVFGVNPYRGYLTNKKWIYNEDNIIFILLKLMQWVRQG